MDRLLQIAAQAGRALLESGAETYRVEETIVKICEAYKAENANSFVLPTGIFTSFLYEGKNYSLVMRVKKQATDLDQIDAINQLARSVVENPISIDDLEILLKEITARKRYALNTIVLFAGIGAFGFALFFNGSYKDAFCAFGIGMLVKWTTWNLSKFDVSNFISNIVGGFLTTLFAIILVHLRLGNSSDTIIIAAIMLLVPGIAITNAIRDSLAGDLVSGIARAVEAVLIAVSVALGTGLALGLVMLLGGII